MSAVRHRVLIADDHLVVRRGLQSIIESAPDLEFAGEAATGEETLEAFKACRPDLVLLDMRMPGPKGPAVIAALRAEDPAARILVLTIQGGDEAAYRALQAGAAGYVLKEEPCAQILEAIRTVCAGRTYLPSGLAERLADRLGKPEFSAREIEVVTLVARGLTNRDVGSRLGISEKAVEQHVAGLLVKLGARDRTHAARLALERGLFDLTDLGD
jgi:two-component system NarL family response regulator